MIQVVMWVRAIGLALLTAVTLSAPAHAWLIGATGADAGTPAFTIGYNGGEVIAGHAQTFAIYYGDFTDANAGRPIAAETVFDNFLTNVNGTTYLNIGSTFKGAINGPVTSDIAFGGSAHLDAYLGNSLSDANILDIVGHAQALNLVPTVANAIYFVNTAPGIAQEEDQVACGWHDGDLTSHTIYAWISPALGCDYLGNVSGNAVGDSFTETGSHEFLEALTDPFPPSAYSDGTVGEVGDVCVTHNFAGDLNGTRTDLQTIWALAPGRSNGGACARGATFPTPEPPGVAVAAWGVASFALARRVRARRARGECS